MSNSTLVTAKNTAENVFPHDYLTSIGLDVHARSIVGCALDKLTGEISTRSFKHYEVDELIEWINTFDAAHVVYESGVTGFSLYRTLKAAGIDVAVIAVSRVPKSVKDKLVKTDKGDAAMLARLDTYQMLTEVFVPSEEYEAARDLSRALNQTTQNLSGARQRLSKFLLRRGYLFDERSSSGAPKGTWTRAHWAWIDTIELKGAASDALDHYISEVRHLEKEKKRLEALIKKYAQQELFKERVDALCLIKGISIITAFALVAEVALFSRFNSATEFMSYLGLCPSEHSSGEHLMRGAITKCGNKYLRKLLVESAWHYMRMTAVPKVPKDSCNAAAYRIARESTQRLVTRFRALLAKNKKSVVVNCACAREMAGFIWAIGRCCEGTLA